MSALLSSPMLTSFSHLTWSACDMIGWFSHCLRPKEPSLYLRGKIRTHRVLMSLSAYFPIFLCDHKVYSEEHPKSLLPVWSNESLDSVQNGSYNAGAKWTKLLGFFILWLQYGIMCLLTKKYNLHLSVSPIRLRKELLTENGKSKY